MQVLFSQLRHSVGLTAVWRLVWQVWQIAFGLKKIFFTVSHFLGVEDPSVFMHKSVAVVLWC